MSPRRLRWKAASEKSPASGDGSPTLGDIFMKAAKQGGKSWLRYNEAPQVTKSKRERDKIIKHSEFLVECRSLQDNLAFLRDDVKPLMEQVFDELGESWHMKAKQKDDWTEAMTRRFQNITYNARKAGQTPKPARWVHRAGLAMKNLDKDMKDEEDEDEEKDKVKYTTSFNIEIGLATRKKLLPHGKSGLVEVSLPISQKELQKLKPTDAIFAQWPDGSSLQIAEMTRERYEALRVRGSQKSVELMWEMEAASTRHKIWVAQRVDRSLLCSLYEQDKQICQIRVDLFGDLEAPQPRKMDNDHEAVKKAAQVMIEIGKKYASGEIAQGDKEALYKLRDTLTKDVVVSKKAKGPKKEKTGSMSGEVAATTGAAPIRKTPAASKRSAAPKRSEPAATTEAVPGRSAASAAPKRTSAAPKAAKRPRISSAPAAPKSGQGQKAEARPQELQQETAGVAGNGPGCAAGVAGGYPVEAGVGLLLSGWLSQAPPLQNSQGLLRRFG